MEIGIVRSYRFGFSHRGGAMTEHEKQQSKRCSLCGNPISAGRLEALPGVTTCIECAKKHPRKFDSRAIDLSQASPINRNGFAPTD
jgi:hypothetical protein